MKLTTLVLLVLCSSLAMAEPLFILKRPNSLIKLEDQSNLHFNKAEGVATIDANADGLPDLLYPPSFFNREPELPLVIFLNMGDGRFVESANSVIDIVPTIGYLNHPTIIADFNGDGADDAFLVDQGLEIGGPSTFLFAQPKLLLSNGTGGLINATSTHLPPIKEFNHNASAGDVDNDGDLDILVVALSDLHVYLLVNDGTGHFELRTDIFPDTEQSSTDHIGAVKLADVNGDCRLDVILGSFWDVESFMAISLQTESGQFADHQRFPIKEDINEARVDQSVAEDFDSDGDVDIIAKFDVFDDSNNEGLIALRNDGGIFVEVTENWLSASRFADLLPRPPAGLEVHDINGDGAPDLFFANYGIPIAQLDQFLLLNDGKGHFSPMPNAAIDEQLGIIPFYTDFDVDGDLDIVGFMPQIDDIPSGEFVQTGYEIVVLENTSNIAMGNISFQCPPLFKNGFEG